MRPYIYFASFVMLPTFFLICSFSISAAVIFTLGWVYFRTREIAILVYLLDRIINPYLTQLVSAVPSDRIPVWLGNVEGERVANWLYAVRMISAAVEAGILIWLILSLAKRW